MRFTLAGEAFDLDATAVIRRLEGHQPEDIRDHWVEIEGVRWPVKQVVGLATGVARTRFVSTQSRSILNRLGFDLGTGARPDREQGERASRSTAPRRVSTKVDLRPLDSLSMELAFTWLQAGPVTLDDAGVPAFPALPKDPGLYRFDFGLDDEGVRTLYVGESKSIARRANNYRNAKTDRSRQRTSRRIHREVVAHLAAGGSIDFSVVTAVNVGGNPVDLARTSARRLAENAAVLRAQLTTAVSVLNIDTDLPEAEPASKPAL